MGNLLIAVGGSGQHIALAVSRLVKFGAMKEIELVVVDADMQGKLAEKLRSCDGYADSGQEIGHPLPHGGDDFLRPFDSSRAAEAGTGGLQFQSLVLGNEPRDATSSAVFQSLFTTRDAEQDVLRGFYARPTLGATAFAARNDAVSSLRTRVESAQRVVIVGSFIGGTGAGVLPNIIEQLAKPESWYGVFLLQWLQAAGTGKSNIRVEDMTVNAQHGLDFFYRKMRHRLSGTVFLGPDSTGGTAMLGPAAPAKDEDETVALFPLLAAYAVHEFCADATSNLKSGVFAYGHDPNSPRFLLDQKWSSADKLADHVKAAARAVAALDHYCADNPEASENVRKLEKAFGLFGSRSHVPNGLYESIQNHAAKCGAKGHRDEFIASLVGALKHRSSALGRDVRWLATIYSPAGGLGNDPKCEAIERDRLETLRAAWEREQPFDEKLKSERDFNVVARSLAKKLVDTLVASCRALV